MTIRGHALHSDSVGPTHGWRQWWLTLWVAGAAFCAYFCMYAFRKPFAAASFSGLDFAGTHFGLKSALVISQVIGYALSKFIGIKVCSEIGPRRRALALLGLIAAAEMALVLFGLLPPSWRVIAIFLNGIPLGMVWGLVVAYLEGRKTSEFLLAALSCSFIVSSGVVKDAGRWTMSSWHVSEAWMPAVTGLIFLPGFLLSVALLAMAPAPTAADIAARTRRQPMHTGRMAFVRTFAVGLVPLVIFYFMLTAFRDYRDNFGIELFKAMGYGSEPGVFSRTETPVAFAVLAILGALSLIRDNRRGLAAAFAIMVGGTALIGVATLLFSAGMISGIVWMILLGAGGYLAYVPVGSMLFDRLIAHTRSVGTAVFAIYLADAIGYTGAIGVLLYKEFASHATAPLAFFRGLSYLVSIAGGITLLASAVYFVSRRACLDTGLQMPRHEQLPEISVDRLPASPSLPAQA